MRKFKTFYESLTKHEKSQLPGVVILGVGILCFVGLILYGVVLLLKAFGL